MTDHIDVTSLRNRRAVGRWERMSVGDVFERNTWGFPDKEAVVGWDGAYADPVFQRLTYRQADRLANQVAHALLDRGVRDAARVLMFCENSVEAVLLKVGTAKAGAVGVPINPNLAPDVLAHIIDLVEPAFVIADGELVDRLLPAMAAAGLGIDVTIPIGGPVAAGSVAFSDFVAGRPETEPDVEIHGDDIWEIQFTSGTTAMPKGVMLSHRYLYACTPAFALSMTRGLRFECDLRMLSFLPVIYHIGDHAMLLQPAFTGGTIVLGRRFDPRQAAEAITRERITGLWGGAAAFVTAIVEAAVADPMSYDLRSLTAIAYAWSALPPGIAAQLERMCGDVRLIGLFGQTESMGAHRWWPQRWSEKYLRTAPRTNYVGVPTPMLSAVVMAEDGTQLRGTPGVTGEMVYRGPAVMSGYYGDEEATRLAFRYGWFHSGDACQYDEADLAIMVDRIKDVIKSGGENVSSLRVEAVLNTHPDVLRSAVVGLPHARWGEAVTAFVLARPGHDPVESDVIAHCKERLAGFEVPKRVIVLEELPETVGAKVLKYQLRAKHTDLYAS